MNDEQIEKKFNELIEELTDEEFWAYTRTWFDEDTILSIMNDWDIETKKNAIKEIKKIKEGLKNE